MTLIIANAFGMTSMFIYWWSNFKKTKKKMLSLHVICNICDIIQYVLLFAPSGIVSAALSLLKNGSFAFLKKGQKQMTFVFSCCKIAALVFAYENVISFLMIIHACMELIILLKGKTKYMLLIGLYSASIWIAYDFTSKAYIAAALGIGSIISLLTASVKNRGKLESFE